MSYYEEQIIKATGCEPSQVSKIEDIMRNDILHSTLDWLTKRQFNKAAKEAYNVYMYMQSDEGKAYIKTLEDKMNKPILNLKQPVKFINPQSGEENIIYTITNYNEVTERCYIEPINLDLKSQELVSINDLVNI